MENKNVEIIETEKEGLSIGDIFKRIWHAKITLGVSFVVVLVGAALAIQYGYSKPQEKFSGSVIYRFSGSENGNYPDGSTFDYRTIVSSQNLLNVQTRDESYASIDIQKMVDENAIEVTLTPVSGYNEQGEEITYQQANNIMISCPASYFKDEDIGKNFLRDVLLSPSRTAASKVEKIYYSANLDLSTAATTYESQISYLSAQRDYILSSYNNLSAVFGEGTPVNMTINGAETSVTIDQVTNIINQYFESYNLSLLSSQANLNYYVKDTDGVANTAAVNDLRAQLQQKEYSLNLAKVNLNSLLEIWTQLYGDFSAGNGSIIVNPDNSLSTQIYNTKVQINQLEQDISDLKNKLGEGTSNTEIKFAPEEYKNTLVDITEHLTQYTSDLKTNSIYLYNNELETYSALPSYVELDGGLSLILNLAVSFVLAVIIACLISGVKGNIDMKKEEKNKDDSLEIIDNTETAEAK